MNHDSVYEEWQKLCDQHEAARSDYFNALSAVNQKFAAIAKGTSQVNPTEIEAAKFESTWAAWDEVKRKMDAFVKKHA